MATYVFSDFFFFFFFLNQKMVLMVTGFFCSENLMKIVLRIEKFVKPFTGSTKMKKNQMFKKLKCICSNIIRTRFPTYSLDMDLFFSGRRPDAEDQSEDGWPPSRVAAGFEEATWRFRQVVVVASVDLTEMKHIRGLKDKISNSNNQTVC